MYVYKQSQFLALGDNQRSLDLSFNKYYHFSHCLQVTGASTFKDCVIYRNGKMAQKSIYQCFGGSSNKNTLSEGNLLNKCNPNKI